MEENKKPKLITAKEIQDKLPEDSFIKVKPESIIWVPVRGDYAKELETLMDYMFKDNSEEEQLEFLTKFNLSISNETEFLRAINDGEIQVNEHEAMLAIIYSLYHAILGYATNQEDVEYAPIDKVAESLEPIINDQIVIKDDEDSSGPIVIQPSED